MNGVVVRREWKPIESIFTEFPNEVDLSDVGKTFPEWVIDYREELLTNVGRKFRKLCHTLKDGGIDFKMKYPIHIDGKWKYADILIPKSHVVVLFIHNHEIYGLPCHSKTNKEMWFGDRYRTLAIHEFEIHHVLEKLTQKHLESPKSYLAYCDGSNNNRDPRRPAGAAYIILDQNENELHRASKGFLGKTNNEMELLAIISAVNWVPDGASVIVHSDSQYSINVLSGRMKAKKNLNLVERYKQVSQGKDVTFKWVKGHSGNYWNEVCDKLANGEYQKLKF